MLPNEVFQDILFTWVYLHQHQEIESRQGLRGLWLLGSGFRCCSRIPSGGRRCSSLEVSNFLMLPSIAIAMRFVDVAGRSTKFELQAKQSLLVKVCLCALVFWICDFLVTYTMPILLNSVGLVGVPGFFASVCFVLFVFVFLRVPETKGMPSEVITEFFAIGGQTRR
ncbi:tonoplast monosaccharide transporter2 [Striga asiatica]|uniref:Tonoplast monosaccharide transporter2 n=1 Tax=Striga asiatica TaxID=4170 RepID=A0A5A7QF79_STRAF|nr:tonoplast monosaccharide transporter2 [Striga asiatica]